MHCKFDIVVSGMNFYRTRKCRRRAVEGGYCTLHTPEVRANRQANKDAAAATRLTAKVQRSIYLKYRIKPN
jgi:hypothetical protein